MNGFFMKFYTGVMCINYVPSTVSEYDTELPIDLSDLKSHLQSNKNHKYNTNSSVGLSISGGVEIPYQYLQA